MKILVISLLRLGDVIVHREVARSLKMQYPGCEIHFLIYKQFQSVDKLIPEVDHWHFIDRNEIQKILVEREQSPIRAFRQLEAVIADLNSRRFDLTLNATHNKVSVRIMDLLISKEKRGVALENGKKVPDQNKWQTYLNENFSEIKGSRFHYLEVLQRSLELSFQLPVQGKKRRPKLILIQLLTSDPKKNWGVEKFYELKKRIEAEFPQDQVFGICSPEEKDEVQKIFGWNEFLTPNLEEAALLLKEARLLITGDTSIQHLAAQQGCPVVSLFLGSADPIKTTPWQLDAWVIQGQAECSPCAHSSKCHQSSHVCGESISIQAVFALVEGVLKEKEIRISGSKLYKTEVLDRSVAVVPIENSFRRNLEQIVWSAYLNSENSIEVSQLRPTMGQVKALWREHEKFKKAVQEYQNGKFEINQMEERFPQWKDSLIRLKRDLRGWNELQELMSIRSRILQRLMGQTEALKNGKTRTSDSDNFASA